MEHKEKLKTGGTRSEERFRSFNDCGSSPLCGLTLLGLRRGSHFSSVKS